MAAAAQHAEAAMALTAAAEAQATLLTQSTSYGIVETAAALEARHIAAAMAASLRECSDAEATAGGPPGGGLRRQQTSAASSAITDALAAYSRASSAESHASAGAPPAAGRMGSLGMTDPLDAVQEDGGAGGARKVSACSVVTSSTPGPNGPPRASSSGCRGIGGDMLAAAALSEYRRKESEGPAQVPQGILSPNSPDMVTSSSAQLRRKESEGSVASAAAVSAHNDVAVTMSLSAYRHMESGGSASSANGLKSPPPVSEMSGVEPTQPLKATHSGPIKKRLKMVATDKKALSGAEDGVGSERKDETPSVTNSGDGRGIALVDRVPALPKFSHSASDNNKNMADDSSISTAGSLARQKSGDPGNGDSEYVLSCTPISLYAPEDRQWLSDLLCFLRCQIEVFVATPEDVAARSRRGGIKEPIAVGRVGIRCRHCVHIPQGKRSKGAVSYPKSIRIVHQAVRNWQRYHFKSCPHISSELKEEFKTFKSTRCHSGNSSLKYWIESCEALGMIDTPGSGIRLKRLGARRPEENVVSAVPSAGDVLMGEKKSDGDCSASVATHATGYSIRDDEEMSHVSQHPDLPVRKFPATLLDPSSDEAITSFLRLLLSQQQPTLYQEMDRPGKRRSRPLNFPGVECRHCSSRVASSGRYFPLTATTLGNNNNPHNCVHSHLLKCRRCPKEVKEELNVLADRHASEGEGLPSGWKKRFFDGVWGRLHGRPSPPPSACGDGPVEDDDEEGEEKKTDATENHGGGEEKETGSDEDVGVAAAALSALSGLSGLKRGHSQC
uniref:Uncharacterized protein n=1 Tax=Odontella aurita TaxID=265563 RepID=A0A7S4J0K7_9STRA